mmetsp:Transcript_24351/g.29727  ORF Transcript_24351/g.29727 Transcript_24351/m.29727 type:complete len:146 (+) Transcript_24351:277-714(+)
MSFLTLDLTECTCWNRDKNVKYPIVKKNRELIRLTFGDPDTDTKNFGENNEDNKQTPIYVYVGGQLVRGSDEIMRKKEHGSTSTEVQKYLRWNVDRQKADRICSHNRHYAEHRHYASSLGFWSLENSSKVEFYDSVSAWLAKFQG